MIQFKLTLLLVMTTCWQVATCFVSLCLRNTPLYFQQDLTDGSTAVTNQDFESLVLMRMRQAEERRKLTEQLQAEDTWHRRETQSKLRWNIFTEDTFNYCWLSRQQLMKEIRDSCIKWYWLFLLWKQCMRCVDRWLKSGTLSCWCSSCRQSSA